MLHKDTSSGKVKIQKCKMCGKEYDNCESSTSNARRHLSNTHHMKLGKAVSKRVNSIDLNSVKKWSRESKENKDIDKAIAMCIVENNLSLRIIETNSFKRLLKEEYSPCSTGTFKDQVLFPLCNETKAAIMQELEGIDFFGHQ